MTIHKEGYTSIALCILFIFISNALIQFYLPQATTFKWIIYILSAIFFVAVIYFFRSPTINVVLDDNAFLSPASGKVVAIDEVDEPEFLKGRAIKILIAISAFNNHVNLNPITGKVKYIKSDGHTTIATESSTGVVIVYRQIPGITKRVISLLKEGDTVKQGTKFGFAMLGSRIDVFLPVGTKTNVNIDDIVKAGQTVLARSNS